MPNEIHQVGSVLAVVNGEIDIESNLLGIHPKQPRADAMKCSRPCQRIRHDSGLGVEPLAADTFDATGHFRRGPTVKVISNIRRQA